MTGKPRRVDQLILHLAVAANAVGLGVILALLADLQDAYALPTAGLGLIAGSSFVAAFFAYVWLSRYADRGHAKAMLIAGTLLGAAALILAAYARELWTFVAARAILGLAEGAFVPAARRVVLDWTPNKPGEVLGRILAASVAGFALGPVIGVLLAEQFGLQVPFLAPAAVLLLAVPVVFRLRAPAPVPISEEKPTLSLLRNRLVLAGLAFGAIDFATIGTVDALWARLLTDRGASTVFVGASFTLMAIPMIGLAPVFGRLADRLTPTRVGRLAMLLVVPALLGYGWLEAPVLLAITGIVHAVGIAALAPAGAALVAAGSPLDMVARGQGLLEAVGFLAAAAASFPSGWAYETIGRTTWFAGMAALVVGLFAVGLSLGSPRVETGGSLRE